MAIKCYGGSNVAIERIANSVREIVEEQAQVQFRGRKLLDKIVASTGGVIKMTDDPTQQEMEGGSLIIKGESDFTIYLSPFTTPLRDNFTIAHELGHYFLHFLLQEDRLVTPVGFTRYGSGRHEWQANRFAAALLMPEKEFREKVNQVKGDSFRLSGYFEVSRPAVKARADSLSLEVS